MEDEIVKVFGKNQIIKVSCEMQQGSGLYIQGTAQPLDRYKIRQAFLENHLDSRGDGSLRAHVVMILMEEANSRFKFKCTQVENLIIQNGVKAIQSTCRDTTVETVEAAPQEQKFRGHVSKRKATGEKQRRQEERQDQTVSGKPRVERHAKRKESNSTEAFSGRTERSHKYEVQITCTRAII